MTTESPENNNVENEAQASVVENQDQNSNEPQVEQAADAVEAELSVEQQKISELELALAAAQGTVADQKDSVIRAKAEVDNIRRRAAQDVEKARKFALEKFSAEMLVTVDNLERALQNIDKEDEAMQSVIEGLELTYKGLISSLEKFDIKAIDPQDQPFDPNLHQAMSMQEVPGVPANTVIAVMQKGYELSGRVIRPAMVMVSKASAEPSVDTQA